MVMSQLRLDVYVQLQVDWIKTYLQERLTLPFR